MLHATVSVTDWPEKRRPHREGGKPLILYVLRFSYGVDVIMVQVGRVIRLLRKTLISLVQINTHIEGLF